jgi:DNA-binding beta-propeller fold protein YncE
MSRLPLALLILFAHAACASAQSTEQAEHTGTIPQDSGYVLFVGLESEDAVAIMDPQAGSLIRKIPIGISTEDIEGVHALDVSPDGEHYYLSIAHGWPYGSVWKMSTQKDSLVGRTNVGLFPATMAITPDGTWLFVANYNLHGDPQLDTVSVVHTPTMTEVQQIPVCTKPHGLVVSNDGESVYVSCTRDVRGGGFDQYVDRRGPGGRQSVLSGWPRALEG